MLTIDHHTRLVRQRWLSYGLLTTTFLLAYFHRMAPAVLATELQQAFDATGTALGILGAAYFITYTAMQIPSGIFADTLGARLVVALGSIVTGIGALSFGMSETLTGAIVGRLLVGLGVSVIYLATLKIIAEWFPERQFATLTGLTVLIGNVGGLVAATPLSWAITIVSWRTVFVILAGVSLALGVAIYLAVRNKPQDIGLEPIHQHRKTSTKDKISWGASAKEVLKHRQTWWGFAVSLGQGGMVFAFMGLWVGPYLRDVHHMSDVVAANHISLLLIGFALGAVALGNLSDRLGLRRAPMIWSFIINLACWVPLILGIHMPQPLSLALLFILGFSSAGYILTLSVAKESNRPQLSGMATGIVNMGTFLGAMIFQPLVGWIMDFKGDVIVENGVRVYQLNNYQWGMGALATAVLFGFLCAFAVKETYCRSSY